MAFKILGLKILNCDRSIRKLLSLNTIYKFYHNYEISEQDYNYTITCTDNRLSELYKIKKDISISAVVGKNGSGKSTLFEMLFQGIYNICCIKGILFNEEINEYLSVEDIQNYVNLDLIYEVDNQFYVIRIANTEAFYLSVNNEKRILSEESNKEYFEQFFYSVVMNYSHHGLNERHLGKWIKSVFHKNDGYQTPIVINPYRKEGNFDINGEEYLVKSRLIANILTSMDDEKSKELFNTSLLNNKNISSLKVSLNKDKISQNKKSNIELREKRRRLNEELLNVVYKQFLNSDYYNDLPTTEEIEWAELYILNKIENIVNKYPSYSKFQSTFKRYKYTDIQKLIERLYSDKSHITFKLRQAINYIRNPFLNKKGDEFNLDINETSLLLNEKAKEYKCDLIELLPPSFFNIEIILKENGKFESLSSGEKQKIFSISTVLYHLININSVDREYSQNIFYSFVNIIFDEIELYFHPDYQRNFISDFLEVINNASLDNVLAINCIFITHSPFILSDIPKQNILFLNEKGEQVHPIEEFTFGANIHDLLRNSFFLNDGLLGKFAKSKIGEIIQYLRIKEIDLKLKSKEKLNNEEIDILTKEKKSLLINQVEIGDEDCLSIIENIGEPVIKIKLKEMYLNTLSTSKKNLFIDKEIERLQKLKDL